MVDIEMVTDEVHTIFRHQRDLGSDIATEELEGEYLSALRWLTDTSARDKKIYSRVGYCTYLGAPEKRAASSLIERPSRSDRFTRSQLGGIRAAPIACAQLLPRHPE